MKAQENVSVQDQMTGQQQGWELQAADSHADASVGQCLSFIPSFSSTPLHSSLTQRYTCTSVQMLSLS